MVDLGTILDTVVDGLIKENPDLSDAEATLIAIRLNLTVLATTLAQMGMNGESIDDAGLYGLTSGIVQTCEWLLAKELNEQTMGDIEKELGGETA